MQNGEPTRFRVIVIGSAKWSNLDAVSAALSEWLDQHSGSVTLITGDTPAGPEWYARHWWAEVIEPSYGDQPMPVEFHQQNAALDPVAEEMMFNKIVSAGADVAISFIRNQSAGATSLLNKVRNAGIPTIEYTLMDSRPTQPWENH